MSLAKKIFKLSEKGIGKVIFTAFIMGLLFGASMFLSFMRGFDEEEIRKIADETGCKIVNYELQCDVEKYEKKDLLIDLNYEENDDSKDKNKVLLAKEFLILEGTEFSYKDVLKRLGSDGNYSVDDLINSYKSTYKFLTVVLVIGGTIFYLLANVLLAAVMRMLINAFLRTNFTFQRMYKLTIYTSFPYVVFNALTRMVIGVRLSDLVPFFFVPFIIDYLIIYCITYYVVKKGYVKEEEVVSI